MPHLQFDINKKLKSEQRKTFTEFVKKKICRNNENWRRAYRN